MPAVTVRNIPEATHRALRVRAKQHGRSTEAEIRAILEQAVQPEILVGDALAEFGKRYGGLDLTIQRDKSPAQGAEFQ